MRYSPRGGISLNAEVHVLQTALESGDYETIRVLGHNFRGSGTPYGFATISHIGRSLEWPAERQSPDEIRRQIAALGDYLAQVTVGWIEVSCPAGGVAISFPSLSRLSFVPKQKYPAGCLSV